MEPEPLNKVLLPGELRALWDSAPDLAGPRTREHYDWLGRTSALLVHYDRGEASFFRVAADGLSFKSLLASNIDRIFNVLNRAIHATALQVPAGPQQVYGPGAVYDFMKGVRQLVASSQISLLIVDQDLDADIFDAYVSTVQPQVSVRLLTRRSHANLASALKKFTQQNPLKIEARRHPVHDRVVFVDGTSCWLIGQSIKDAAKSLPTYIAPLPNDVVGVKLSHYEKIWDEATPV